MDGGEGEHHPEWAARFAKNWLDKKDPGYSLEDEYWEYYFLCLLHSRTCAKLHGEPPSKLCWADKLCIKYDPWWLYIPRALLSGEIWEYRNDAIRHGLVPENATHREWFVWARERGMRAGYTQNPKRAYELEQK